MKPTVRSMRPSDIVRVEQIERVSFFSPWSLSYFQRCLVRGDQGWVVEVDGEIEGYLIVAHSPGVAHLLNLCVAPEQRRQGLGRLLLRHLVGVARRHALDSVILEVRISNLEALKLYQAEGFIELGVRRDYYPAPVGREDARVMCLRL